MAQLVLVDGFFRRDSKLKEYIHNKYHKYRGERELVFVFLPGICEVLNTPKISWWNWRKMEFLFQQIEVINKNILFFLKNNEKRNIIFVKTSVDTISQQYVKNSIEILKIKRPELNFSYEIVCYLEESQVNQENAISFNDIGTNLEDINTNNLSVVSIDSIMTEKYYKKTTREILLKLLSNQTTR